MSLALIQPPSRACPVFRSPTPCRAESGSSASSSGRPGVSPSPQVVPAHLHPTCSRHAAAGHRHWALAAFQPGAPSAPPSTLQPELRAALEKFISEHKVVLFMKGTKQFPQCGFSNTCVQILNMLGGPYETVNVLEDDSLRMGMKEFSQWPTFPQVYIDGEFYGGCDILIEAFQSGELQEQMEALLNS